MLSLRRCALSAERLPPARLLRFVLDAHGGMRLDPLHALGGRGIWIKPERALLARLAVEKSAERRALARAARRLVKVSGDFLPETVTALQDCLTELSARAARAGTAPGSGSSPLLRRLALVRFCLDGLCAPSGN